MKVSIFIDDLDRVEGAKAADVMRAINLLMSSESSRFLFILGLDRRIVAASLAARASAILPYLNAFSSQEASAQAGLEYGYGFLDKFIQIPIAVPRPSSASLPGFLSSLDPASSEKPEDIPITHSEGRPSEVAVTFASDAPQLREIVSMVAESLDFNPRRLKQFVNIFRLRTIIASNTGLFWRVDAGGNILSLEQLAKFTALSLRWPSLVSDLASDPSILRSVAKGEVRASGSAEYWTNNAALRRLVRYEGNAAAFDMANVDVPTLLAVSPPFLHDPSSPGVRDATSESSSALTNSQRELDHASDPRRLWQRRR